MSDTNRYMTHRRPPVRASSAPLKAGEARKVFETSPDAARRAAAAGLIPAGVLSSTTPPERVEALRKLVAAGQYQVSPRWLAAKIFRAAGLKQPQ